MAALLERRCGQTRPKFDENTESEAVPTLIRPWSRSKSRQLPCPDVVASSGVLAPLRIDQNFASGSEVSVPALGVEERSDEAPRAGRAGPTPDPEVVAKPKRRQFTAEYRLRILEEADRCTQPGEVGRLLRREGLYSSHLTAWRKARRKGSLRELAAKKRGAKPAERNPLDAKVRALEAQVARLEHELHTAHTILDVQGKVAGLLGLNLEHGTRS